MGVSSETYSVEGRPETWGVVSGDAGGHGGTHLNGAAVPGEDGSLALCGKEIGLALCELCAEYLCVTVDELGGVSGGRGGGGEGRTLMARVAAGSSSKRYSVAGRRRHSLSIPASAGY